MKAFLCIFAAWIVLNFLVSAAIQLGALRRVNVPKRYAWGGLSMSVLALVVWCTVVMVVLIATRNDEVARTNGELMITCLTWAGLPILLTPVMHVVGMIKVRASPLKNRAPV